MDNEVRESGCRSFIRAVPRGGIVRSGTPKQSQLVRLFEHSIYKLLSLVTIDDTVIAQRLFDPRDVRFIQGRIESRLFRNVKEWGGFLTWRKTLRL